MPLHNANAVQMYQHFFDGFLLPDEQILNAAPSIHVETSTRFGRGTGDGTLAVTSARVVHVYLVGIMNSSGFAVPRKDIKETRKGRIIIPKTSNLRISGVTNGNSWTHNFYLGNRFLDDVIGDLKL